MAKKPLTKKIAGMLPFSDEAFKNKVDRHAKHIINAVKRAYDNDIRFLPSNNLPKLDNALHTRNILEYSVWYSGKQSQLKRFYRQTVWNLEGQELFKDRTSFWRDNREDETYIFTHTGLPQSITQCMVDLETLSGYEFTINGDEDGEIYERLETILKNSNFDGEQWQNGTALKSVFGGAVYRPIINTNIADTPIIESVQPEQYRLQSENGHITGITFVNTIKDEDRHGNEQWTEILEHNEKKGKDIHIRYECLRYLHGKVEPISVKFSEIFGADKAKMYKDKVLPGFGQLLPVYIKNKSSNSEFRGSIYGESDYSNNIDLFHAIDQSNSSLVNQLADSQIKTLVNETLIDKNTNGNWNTWRKWRRNMVITKGDQEEVGSQNMIDHSQGVIDVDGHVGTIDYLTQQILANVGLAPEELGLAGASADASGTAIRERSNVSLRTREKKLKLQKEGLQKLFANCLRLEDIMNGKTPGDYDVNVTFRSFVQSTDEEKLELAAKAMGTGIFDERTVLEMFFGELSDDEVDEIMTRVEEAEMRAAGLQTPQAGEENGKIAGEEVKQGHKLSPEQISEIENRLAGGARQKDLADEFGVDQGTISRIKSKSN